MYEREPIEEWQHAGCTCRLVYDDNPMSPDDWDTLGTFVQWSRSYTFGEPAEGNRLEALRRGGISLLDRYLRIVEGASCIVPVGMIDHSGISVYAGGGPAIGDAAGWDSGTVGLMFTTPDRVRELCGAGAPYETEEWQAEALRGEIRTWDDYLTGSVVGYEVEANGAHVDSCYGFYPEESKQGDVHGLEYVRAEANGAAEAERDERARAAVQDIATA